MRVRPAAPILPGRKKNREVTTGDEVVQRYGDTVDGQHQETTNDDDYPIIFRVLKNPRWCRILSINSMI